MVRIGPFNERQRPKKLISTSEGCWLVRRINSWQDHLKETRTEKTVQTQEEGYPCIGLGLVGFRSSMPAFSDVQGGEFLHYFVGRNAQD